MSLKISLLAKLLPKLRDIYVGQYMMAVTDSDDDEAGEKERRPVLQSESRIAFEALLDRMFT